MNFKIVKGIVNLAKLLKFQLIANVQNRSYSSSDIFIATKQLVFKPLLVRVEKLYIVFKRVGYCNVLSSLFMFHTKPTRFSYVRDMFIAVTVKKLTSAV